MKKRAVAHTEYVQKNLAAEISNSINNTYIRDEKICGTYVPPVLLEKYTTDVECIVNPLDTVTSIYNAFEPNEKIAVLNFASYKNPGGMFMNGSVAQEECLCHESILYNVLAAFEYDYYEPNRKYTNRALYTNRLLYSEDIVFEREDSPIKANIITCAAPNKYAAKKYCGVSDIVASNALESRIKFVLDTAAVYDNRILVLGAYGCGVFGNNPTEVASIFKKFLTGDYKHAFKKVYFSIPGGENYDKFVDVFSKKS